MATIWYMKEGEIQRGSAAGERSIDWCVEQVGLKESNWIAGLETRNLTIGEKTPMSDYRGNRFVVVEINDSGRKDSSGKSWATGYYLLEDKDPGDVFPLLNNP